MTSNAGFAAEILTEDTAFRWSGEYQKYLPDHRAFQLVIGNVVNGVRGPYLKVLQNNTEKRHKISDGFFFFFNL